MYTGNANDDDEEDDVFNNDNNDNNDNNVNNDNNDNNDYDDDSHKRCIYCISNRYYAHRCHGSLFFKTIWTTLRRVMITTPDDDETTM